MNDLLELFVYVLPSKSYNVAVWAARESEKPTNFKNLIKGILAKAPTSPYVVAWPLSRCGWQMGQFTSCRWRHQLRISFYSIVFTDCEGPKIAFFLYSMLIITNKLPRLHVNLDKNYYNQRLVDSLTTSDRSFEIDIRLNFPWKVKLLNSVMTWTINFPVELSERTATMASQPKLCEPYSGQKFWLSWRVNSELHEKNRVLIIAWTFTRV